MSQEYEDKDIRNLSYCKKCNLNRRIKDLDFNPETNTITETLECGHKNTTTPEIDEGKLEFIE